MPNTLQYTASGPHHEAHVRLGIERNIRARITDQWQQLVAELGEEAARKVWTDSDRLFRVAERQHLAFHGRES